MTQPESAPRILFFSGGTALRDTARHLKTVTHNSVHIVTPFDSGGSSARLRQAFGMPSVGDLRNRLMALGDEALPGNPELFAVVNHRLSSTAERPALERELARLSSGDDPRIAALREPVRSIVLAALRAFETARPPDFDLREAKIGNLVLTGRYLETGRDLDRVIDEFSPLAGIRGTVRAVTNADVHLAATLEDGSVVVGQHRITGPADGLAPIRDLSLVRSLEDPSPVDVAASDRVLEHIRTADLIVYPMGSFFTSVCANLLPRGIAEAVRAAPARKIHVPNTTPDPEQRGLDVQGAVARLEALTGPGIGVLTHDLVTEASAPHVDPARLVAALLELAS